MCLTGFPYGLIFSLDKTLERMINAHSVQYQSNAYVISIEEKANKVIVNLIDTSTKDKQTDTFDRVFVGACALSSARIMLNSMKAYNQHVPVKDSAKFAIPMLRMPSAAFEWPNVNTLADLFIDAVFPEVSQHWLHVQVSPLNELMLKALYMHDGHTGRVLNRLGRIAKPLTSRVMVAWCAMHSDLSSECELSVSPGHDGLPILNITKGVERSAINVAAYSRKLMRMGMKFRTLFATPVTMLSPSSSTGHCGGSFPMREAPHAPFETDTLGRLKKFKRVHLVDASTFPSIPGTTIALLILSNARRIVAEAPLESTS